MTGYFCFEALVNEISPFFFSTSLLLYKRATDLSVDYVPCYIAEIVL